MNTTKIEYLHKTWNPIVMRCTPISAGCANCWHLRYCHRMKDNLDFTIERRRVYSGIGKPYLDDSELYAPLHTRKPCRIGLMFMGDIAHDSIPDAMAQRVLGAAKKAIAEKGHTILVLTKRIERLARLLPIAPDGMWVGVSVEDQETADQRIPHLLKIEAKVRWVSYEPALGPVGFDPWPTLSWIAMGPETGRGARPSKPQWFTETSLWCHGNAVALFDKRPGAQRRDYPA